MLNLQVKTGSQQITSPRQRKDRCMPAVDRIFANSTNDGAP
jgi:hypothetical protein